jgi:hypothetical protein
MIGRPVAAEISQDGMHGTPYYAGFFLKTKNAARGWRLFADS